MHTHKNECGGGGATGRGGGAVDPAEGDGVLEMVAARAAPAARVAIAGILVSPSPFLMSRPVDLVVINVISYSRDAD